MRQLVLASLLAMAAGCVGGLTPTDDDIMPDDDDTPPGTSARVLFETTVYPILSQNCGAGCHLANGSATSTSFVGTSVANGYDTIIGYNSVVGNFTLEGAPVWGKIMSGPQHNGRSYNTDQQAKITAWLAKEVSERQTTPPPTPGDETPGQATARIISEWSGCLKEADFVELRFGEVWANKGSNDGNCEQCHQDGVNGMLANDDNVVEFNAVSGSKYYMLAFFKANVLDPANAMMQPNTQTFYNVGHNLAPYIEHPTFNPDDPSNDPAVAPLAQLQELYNRTAGYLAAGTCGPPRCGVDPVTGCIP